MGMANPRFESNRCIFDITGSLAGESAVDLIGQLRQSALRFPNAELIVDLSGVVEIDAAGIWALIEAKKIGGGVVRITGHSAAVLSRLGILPLSGEPFADTGPVVRQAA